MLKNREKLFGLGMDEDFVAVDVGGQVKWKCLDDKGFVTKFKMFDDTVRTLVKASKNAMSEKLRLSKL